MQTEAKRPRLHFVEGGLSSPATQQLLRDHHNRMVENSPPESRHVLDLNGLQQPNITFWTAWSGSELAGCVALKHWHTNWGEIKSMKTAPSMLRQGIGQQLLAHVIKEARRRNYQVLKLETGSMDYFKAARQLYKVAGFDCCGPFGNYVSDPNNVFMSLAVKG